MKQISTGAGLVALSVAMVATAFIATHRGGSEAFAQQPTLQSAQALHTTGQALATYHPQIDARNVQAATTSCQAETANWLDNNPRVIPVCDAMKAVGVPPLYAADLNGDGQIETFALNYSTIATALESGQQTGEALRITRAFKSQDSNGSPIYEFQMIFDSNDVLASLRQQYPWATTIQFNASLGRGGWLDMDGDGDLDLVIFVSMAENGVRAIEGTLWFENTGYQAAPPPNPYDLDQDGEVGASDISVLLLNYSK